MFVAILVTAVFVFGLGSALRTGHGGMLARRPYNNRYNDASGARQDHLG
jgi:hypothetical protein